MLTTRLTFAVLLRDGFAPRNGLTGGCQISLAGGEAAPVMNRSGHYCFVDLPEGDYTVVTSTKYYLDQEVAVATAVLDPKSPAIVIDLEPSLAYPFPPGTTLLKGRIVDLAGGGVSGAQVEIQSLGRRLVSDQHGMFLFYFKGLDQDEERIRLEISKVGFRDTHHNVDIERGVTGFIKITLRPD